MRGREHTHILVKEVEDDEHSTSAENVEGHELDVHVHEGSWFFFFGVILNWCGALMRGLLDFGKMV